MMTTPPTTARHILDPQAPIPDAGHRLREVRKMVEQRDRLWGVQDVADYLGVPVMTLYHWRQTGYGPKGTRVGRYLRYRPQDVRDWFEAQSRATG